MDSGILLPSWLESYAIDDSRLAEAYALLEPEERAGIKNNIALLHSVLGELRHRYEETTVFSSGTTVTRGSCPIAFCLLVCASAYAFPACYTAALMPPLLAGVPLVIPCFIPDESMVGTGNESVWSTIPDDLRRAEHVGCDPQATLPPPAVLTALELAGVEQTYSLTETAACNLLQELHDHHGQGKLIILGGEGFGDSIFAKAADLRIPYRNFTSPPFYLPVSEENRHTSVTDLFKGVAGADKIIPPLALDAASQSFWLWPSLPLSWFHTAYVRVVEQV